MKRTIPRVCLLLQLSLITAYAQITSFKQQTDGVLLKLQHGVMKVYICTDNIIRVNYSTDTTLPSKKILTVNKIWETPSFTVNDNDTTIVVATSSIRVVTSKANALLSFYSTSGSLILSEDSRQVIPTTVYGVSTHNCIGTFHSPADEAIYGLGQHQQGFMNYKGKTQWLDQANKEIALPIIISNKGYGLLWDNYSRTLFNGNASSGTKYQFNSQCGEMVDYYFIYGPEIDSIISAYRRATGTAPLFPKWAYGLFQSKNRYTSSSDLINVKNLYRDNRIPVDCIVQDWYYWDPYPWGSNIMNPSNYPDPAAIIDSMHMANIHTMISIWATFTQGDPNYSEYSAINALYPSNGTRHYYDPHNDQGRTIYWRQVKEQLFAKYGWDAWWADADEPDTYPDSYDRNTANTALGKGCLYYNTYPLMHTSSVYEGWRNDIPQKRLFTLSRCAFLGNQRNAAASWSGDISCTWTDFKRQLPAGLNFCLSGIPYWTTDIGGYATNWGPTNWATTGNRELFIRWFQYGAFCPIFRIHGVDDKSLLSDFWDTTTKSVLLNYDKLRYRLMPYIYSLAWKVTSENYTIMRHLIMDYRTDANVVNIDNQFMFGPFMMINPVYTAGATNRSVYLPTGDWYDFWTGERISGGTTITIRAPLDTLPIFVKAGSIIPMGPEIEYATQSIDPLEIRVYRGADARFVLYEDEGDTYNYEGGQYSLIPFTYNEASKRLTIGSRQGTYTNMPQTRTFDIVWVDEGHGTGIGVPTKYDTVIHYDGSEVGVLTSVPTSPAVPGRTDLQQNYPNPFNPSTAISFSIQRAGHVSLKIFDLLGREVATIHDGRKNPGSYTVVWNATNFSAGVYFCRLQAGEFIKTRKLLLLR
jgi:alpha-D-xyloside xylohydrolase